MVWSPAKTFYRGKYALTPRLRLPALACSLRNSCGAIPAYRARRGTSSCIGGSSGSPRFFHLRLLGREPCLRRRPAEQTRHTRALVDHDPCGARHTVSASTAEIPCKRLAIALDELLDVRRHLRRILHVRKPLGKLLLALNTPDRHHVVVLRDERHRRAQKLHRLRLCHALDRQRSEPLYHAAPVTSFYHNNLYPAKDNHKKPMDTIRPAW